MVHGIIILNISVRAINYISDVYKRQAIMEPIMIAAAILTPLSLWKMYAFYLYYNTYMGK